MMEEMIIVEFKSYPEYWNKECAGLKRNTVRKIDTDKRFELLKMWMCGKVDKLFIRIRSTDENEGRFTREIRDVSEIDGYYIISW